MTSTTSRALLLAVLVSLPGLPAVAQQAAPSQRAEPPGQLAAQTWFFDESTTGSDIAWSSPTAIDPTASVYAYSFALTLVEVDVQWSFITLNDVDVTDQVPVEQQGGSGTLAGPAPVTFLNEAIVAPAPPEPPALAAVLSMGLDASGQGFLTATGVTLGTLDVDLGFPFGVQTVTIISVRIVGSLTMHPAWYALGGGLPGAGGEPSLLGDGTLEPGSSVSLMLTNGLPFGVSTLVIGFGTLGAPFKGGTLMPTPDVLLFGLPLDGLGSLALGASWPAGLPGGVGIVFQHWIADAGGPFGFAASGAVRAVTP